MFKRIKKFFSKKEEVEVVSAITLYTDDSGETFVDVKMKDDSDESIEHLSSILLMFDQQLLSSFFCFKTAVQNNNNDELYARVIESIVNKAGPEVLLTDYKEGSDDLCINPSDMI